LFSPRIAHAPRPLGAALTVTGPAGTCFRSLAMRASLFIGCPSRCSAERRTPPPIAWEHEGVARACSRENRVSNGQAQRERQGPPIQNRRRPICVRRRSRASQVLDLAPSPLAALQGALDIGRPGTNADFWAAPRAETRAALAVPAPRRRLRENHVPHAGVRCGEVRARTSLSHHRPYLELLYR
jgi:hypothetical protein